MAIPNNYIDKITDHDSGGSRPICPPAEHVQVDNENFEGETLDEVLDEVAQAIDDAGQGGYAPPEGGIPKSDLAQSVQDSLDKADSALQDEDVADFATKTELQQGLGTKQDTLSAGNGITIGSDGKTVSVDAEVVQPVTADGTFAVRIGNNTYTINLNHTHENMAKIVKCTEATLPQTLDNDTIYVQVDNATTPSEIESLWLFGLEFTGGGAAPGTPRLTSPSLSQINNGIDIGNTTSGVATYLLKIKAKDLTQSLLVQWGSESTGYSFNTSNLPTGVTYDSGTGKLTITKEAACEINGVGIPVVYTGNDTDRDAEGTLGISSSSVDGINVEVTLVANKVSYQMIADWEGVDEPSNREWIDRINNIPIGLYGTTAKISDGYRLDNTSAPKKAWCYPPTSQTPFFNAQIDKEFLCIIDCKVKFATADKMAMVIDFGAFGDSRSNLNFNVRILQNGTLESTFKKVSDPNAFSAKGKTAQTGISFPIDTYVDIHIKTGVRILRNGKQELFCECGSGRTYAVLDTPVTVNFSGINVGNPPNTAAFGLAIAYMQETDAVSIAADILSDVVYKKIQILHPEI